MKTKAFYTTATSIAITTELGNYHSINRVAFESWMQRTGKLNWHIDGEYVKLTIADFWKAHPRYIHLMLDDYMQKETVKVFDQVENSLVTIFDSI